MIIKNLLKLISVKFWLALALVLAGLFDLLTTLPMIRFESNPIFFLVDKSVVLFVIIKFLMIGFLIFFVLHRRERNDIRRYFNISIVVLCVMIQLFAGVNNIYTHHRISVYEARTGNVVVPDNVNVALISYSLNVFVLLIYPLVACLSSYVIHKRLVKRDEEPIIKVVK